MGNMSNKVVTLINWPLPLWSNWIGKPINRRSTPIMRIEKQSVRLICNCNLLVYDNKAGNKTVHVCEECAFGWLWSICALLKRHTSKGLRSRSCKLRQMVASFSARNIFHEFLRGRFTVQKMGLVFSNMGADQAHEQNNQVIKADGGAIGILDNENALLE